MPLGSDEYLKRLAPQFARLGIWTGKFAPVQDRLRGVTIQKITASDEGLLCLSVYKHGDDRSSVILSIHKSDPGIFLSHTRPKPQMQPNSFVQIARKHLIGRRVQFAFCSLDPVCFFIACEPHRGDDAAERPDLIILDLEGKPARLMVAKRHVGIPDRYRSVSSPSSTSSAQGSSTASAWSPTHEFYESLCEWSLEMTKTKRRATFDHPPLCYCCMFDATKQKFESVPLLRPHKVLPIAPVPSGVSASPGSAGSSLEPGGPAGGDLSLHEAPQQGFLQHEFGFAEKQAFAQHEMNFAKAMSLLPVHVRKAVKVRLQFLERRLLRQRGDLPPESDISRLTRRAEGLRAHLYLWPEKSHMWYVPQDLIEEHGLPPFFQLKAGQKPGDILEEEFRQLDRIKRRRVELLKRMDESKKAIDDFHDKVTAAGTAIATEIEQIAPHGQYGIRDLGLYLSRIQPAGAAILCRDLDISWSPSGDRPSTGSPSGGGASKGTAQAGTNQTPKHPYRAYRASTGEFIHVARSAADGDLMLKLMPSHHTWLHVLTGEGSHVWLEKPGKADPSPQALREAAILAVHNSRLTRGRQGEVRVATRADIEKKKDLPPGKVLVRRCKTILVKYEPAELENILKPQDPLPSPGNKGPQQGKTP